MTKKHFIRIAASLKGQRRTSGDVDSMVAVNRTLDETARTLADVFGDLNPLFDRARFLQACGVES